MDIPIKSRHLKEFIKEIQYKNRNPRDLKALALLADLSTNPERVLPAGTRMYRGRVAGDGARLHTEEGFWGFGAKESFVPPASATKDMRANYRYIPYLYCSNNPYTALVEVRPRLGAQVSIATIVADEELHLLDFTMGTVTKTMSTAKINLFDDLSALYSNPVTDVDDELDYIPTQYIAEYAKNLGYDGIAFRSSLTPEINGEKQDYFNIVVFQYEKCRPEKSNVVRVCTSVVEAEQIDDDPLPMVILSPYERFMADF